MFDKDDNEEEEEVRMEAAAILKNNFVDQWHFRMLNDKRRNLTYKLAIQQVKHEETVSIRLSFIRKKCCRFLITKLQMECAMIPCSTWDPALACWLLIVPKLVSQTSQAVKSHP